MSTGKSIGIVKLPRRARSGIDVLPWATEVNQCLQQLRDRAVTFKKSKAVLQTVIKPPLFVTLERVAGDPITYEVYAEFGHVVPRHNASSDTGEPIEITALPTPDAPLAVIEDNKLWVKLTIDVDGKCTAADFESGTTFPEDSPPELIGGDDQSGTEGQRYIRIAEIIADPESTATTPPLIREQLHTGHIDHFQPELVENTTTSPSGGDARVLKAWNSSAGKWDLRYLEQGDGVIITENADSIEIKASHPWKVTANGDDTVTVAEGFVFFVQARGSSPPDMKPFGYVPQICESDTLTVTGLGYVYAVVGDGGSDEMVGGIESAFGTGSNLIVDVRGADTITLQFSTDDPSTFNPASASYFYTVANVDVAASVAFVVKQYLTHNPENELVYVSEDT